jgi:hypothetical protein
MVPRGATTKAVYQTQQHDRSGKARNKNHPEPRQHRGRADASAPRQASWETKTTTGAKALVHSCALTRPWKGRSSTVATTSYRKDTGLHLPKPRKNRGQERRAAYTIVGTTVEERTLKRSYAASSTLEERRFQRRVKPPSEHGLQPRWMVPASHNESRPQNPTTRLRRKSAQRYTPNPGHHRGRADASAPRQAPFRARASAPVDGSREPQTKAVHQTRQHDCRGQTAQQEPPSLSPGGAA